MNNIHQKIQLNPVKLLLTITKSYALLNDF